LRPRGSADYLHGRVGNKNNRGQVHSSKHNPIYNLHFGRSSLNKIRAVVSTIHLKMDFPVEDSVITMKFDQEDANKCYKNSLRTRRSANNIAQAYSPTKGANEAKLDPKTLDDHQGQKLMRAERDRDRLRKEDKNRGRSRRTTKV